MVNNSDCRKQMANFYGLAYIFTPKVPSAQTPFVETQGYLIQH